MAAKIELHELLVDSNRAVTTVDDSVVIVAGSIGVDAVHITFEEPADWQDMTLLLTFIHTNGTSIQLAWNGSDTVLVPWEVTQDTGNIGIAIIGSRGDVIQRGLTQTANNLLSVVPAGATVGDVETEATAALVDQLLEALALVEDVQTQMDQAVQDAIDVLESDSAEALATVHEMEGVSSNIANLTEQFITAFNRYLPTSAGNIVLNTLNNNGETVVTADDVFSVNRLKGITLYGKSVQDGTPTPNAPVEIKSVAAALLKLSHDSGTTVDSSTSLFPSTVAPLRSLPDGTHDELVIQADGSRVITRNVDMTTQAVTSGISGTVGVNVMSSTGQIADGATVLYKLATPTTEIISAVEMPSVLSQYLTAWVDATDQNGDAMSGVDFDVTYEVSQEVMMSKITQALAHLGEDLSDYTATVATRELTDANEANTPITEEEIRDAVLQGYFE